MHILFRLKHSVKGALPFVFGSRILHDAIDYFFRRTCHPVIFSVTYHDTPRSDIQNFRDQVIWYKSKFDDCSLANLQRFLDEGVWGKSKPGIIITFDDGLASNYLFASRILDEYGFTGWFMVPAGVIDLPVNDHLAFANNGCMDFSFLDEQTRLFMSREELLDLRKRGHQIVCHSFSHIRLSENLGPEQMNREVSVAKKRIEEALGENIDCFAWVGGEERSYSRAAMCAIEDSGYKFVFATNCSPIYPKQNSMLLERYHVDVKFSLDEVRFSMSWIYRLLYRAKRARVKNILFSK